MLYFSPKSFRFTGATYQSVSLMYISEHEYRHICVCSSTHTIELTQSNSQSYVVTLDIQCIEKIYIL